MSRDIHARLRDLPRSTGWTFSRSRKRQARPPAGYTERYEQAPAELLFFWNPSRKRSGMKLRH
jgi:hypothetical protein